jgi:hypothetical protein
VALTAAAGVITEESGVELGVRSTSEVEDGGHGLGPLGGVVVDLGYPSGASQAMELLASPLPGLLPRVVVSVLPAGMWGVRCSHEPEWVMAFNAAMTDRRLLPDRRPPWLGDGDGGDSVERLFVLDMPAHCHHNVVPLAAPEWPRRRVRRREWAGDKRRAAR